MLDSECLPANAQSKNKDDTTSVLNSDTISVQNSTKIPPQEEFNSFIILADFQPENNPFNIRPVDYGRLLVDHPEKKLIATLKVKTDSLDAYIKSLRMFLDSFPRDSYTEVRKIMIEDKQANMLKKKLISYKKFITGNFTKYITVNKTNEKLNLDLPKNAYCNSWEKYNFHHTSRIATQIMLDKIRSQVHEIERIIVSNIRQDTEK